MKLQLLYRTAKKAKKSGVFSFETLLTMIQRKNLGVTTLLVKYLGPAGIGALTLIGSEMRYQTAVFF